MRVCSEPLIHNWLKFGHSSFIRHKVDIRPRCTWHIHSFELRSSSPCFLNYDPTCHSSLSVQSGFDFHSTCDSFSPSVEAKMAQLGPPRLRGAFSDCLLCFKRTTCDWLQRAPETGAWSHSFGGHDAWESLSAFSNWLASTVRRLVKVKGGVENVLC